jgi:hypothetical protein
MPCGVRTFLGRITPDAAVPLTRQERTVYPRQVLAGNQGPDSIQPRADLGSDLSDPVPVDQGEDRRRVHKVDDHGVISLAKDDIAGEEGTDARFGGDRLVCQRWVAGSEDQIRINVKVEFGLHRCGDIDFGEDAKSLSGESGDDPLLDGVYRTGCGVENTYSAM